ncbi:MAG TPA: L-histidine N(alpha)-methyltransferase [Anaerolineae bacterium]|nr:L-histidine N(alpha)-methyltransferase [Anaerolineae bacterium]
MAQVIVVSPEYELETDYLTEFQRTRKIRQNLFYLMDGAESFYTYRGEDFKALKWQDEYAFFAQQPFWQPDRTLAFVSLGCGNAGAEKMLLRQAHAEGYPFAYFGVDSSRTMLRLADRTLADETFTRMFLLADFSTAMLRQTLEELLGIFDARLYVMLGGTFGNFEQPVIAGILQTLLTPGDYLYLDIVPLYGEPERDQALRARLLQLPQNMPLFFTHLLERLCIAPEAGELYGVETPDPDLEAWRYAYFFRAHDAFTFTCFLGDVALKSGESLELLTVRAYEPEALKTFMATYDFEFVTEYIPDVGRLAHLWQRFLFRKVEIGNGK